MITNTSKTYYLDHAAATPVSQKALQVMLPYFSEQFYNPSAPYLPAKHVREVYEQAKQALANVIGAKGVDLVITSGATESINLAFKACQGKVLTLATEHAAVLEAAKLHDYALIDVDKNGLIELDDLRSKLSDEVELISISLANNEIGTIQPLAEIAELLRQTRQSRLQRGINTPLYLHSDASQALNLLDINVARLGVDLLTINAAKCGGPKGVGALYVAHGVKLSPITVGGGQERGLRSGTENVPGVIGFAVAASEAKAHLAGNRKKYQEMSTKIRHILSYNTIVAQNSKNVNSNQSQSFPQVTDDISPAPIFLGNPKHQLVSFCPVCFTGLDAERLIYRLEARGVLLSTGAACAANKGSKSHVLAAIGLSDAEIAGSIRISLGSTNTLEDITEAAQIIREEVAKEYRRLASSSAHHLSNTTSSSLMKTQAANELAQNESVSTASSSQEEVSNA